MEQKNNTIWVITEMDHGSIKQILTNAPENVDVRSQVFDFDPDYEDSVIVEMGQEYIEKLHQVGKMRGLEDSLYWGILEEETCTFTDRFPDREYTFIQVCELPGGGFGIALCEDNAICLDDYSRDEIMACVGKAGWRHDDKRLEDLDNVYTALCVFRANIDKHIIPDLRFDTFWEARRYLAIHYVDCFVAPEIDYTADLPAVQSLPLCVDVDEALKGFDKKTLVCIALSYDQSVADKSLHSPTDASFRLESFLAKISISEIKQQYAGAKHSVFRRELDHMDVSDIADLLLRYNNRLKDQYRKTGNIQGAEDLDSYLGFLKEGLV